jgi:hypothetical protein
MDSTIELAKTLVCTISVCMGMGEGYSRSTYDGYGIGSVDGEGKVGEDGLHSIALWFG